MATQSFQRILEVLEAHDVDYIVVRGVTAVLRGAPVTTFDIDTLVKTERANAERLLTALRTLDARYREHPGGHEPSIEDVLAGGHLLLMTDSGPLDVLGHIMGDKRYEDMTDSWLSCSSASARANPELTVGFLWLERTEDYQQWRKRMVFHVES